MKYLKSESLSYIKNLRNSKSIKQDLFVLSQLGLKKTDFLEFGATNGIYLSNTFMLEKNLIGWDTCELEKLA